MHYIVLGCDLLDEEKIFLALKLKREFEFAMIKAKLGFDGRSVGDDLQGLRISLDQLKSIFFAEDPDAVIVYCDVEMTFLKAIDMMKTQLSREIVTCIKKKIVTYKEVEQFFLLHGATDQGFEPLVYDTVFEIMDTLKDDHFHYFLVHKMSYIFKHKTPENDRLLERIIEGFYSRRALKAVSYCFDHDQSPSPLKLVFDTYEGCGFHGGMVSLFNIIKNIFSDVLDFDVKYHGFFPRFAEMLANLWDEKVKEEDMMLIETPDDSTRIINNVLFLYLKNMSATFFGKIADFFPAGPCERVMASIEYLISCDNSKNLKEIFSDDMHRSLIEMLERIFFVKSVIENDDLQRRINDLLQYFSAYLPFSLKECMSKSFEKSNTVKRAAQFSVVIQPRESLFSGSLFLASNDIKDTGSRVEKEQEEGKLQFTQVLS